MEQRPQPARIQSKTESEAKVKEKRAEGIPQVTHPPTLLVHTRYGVPSVWLCTPVRSMTAMFGCGGGKHPGDIVKEGEFQQESILRVRANGLHEEL